MAAGSSSAFKIAISGKVWFTVRTVAVVSVPAAVFTGDSPDVASLGAADDRSSRCPLECSV